MGFWIFKDSSVLHERERFLIYQSRHCFICQFNFSGIAAAQAGMLPPGFFWTDADNRDVELTTEQLVQLAGAMTQAMVTEGFRIHERQRQMKAEVDALQTLEDIRAYPVEWPEVESE
uniref:DUF4376 domain-containing protein n=1 Tax=Citrobacter freundii TaxID=546 RepID=UPI00374E87B9